MTKDEALHLALEELENCADLLKVFGAPIDSCVGATMLQAEAAITAIKQALAAPVQEPVAWANPNDLKNFDMKVRTNGGPLHTVALCLCTPPAAVPVQPVSWTLLLVGAHNGLVGKAGEKFLGHPEHYQRVDVYTTPPAAQPAVPDALTSADIQEHIEYVAGWNDCRQAMLEMMK